MLDIAYCHMSPCVASFMLDDLPCIECNIASNPANKIAPMAFSHTIGAFDIFHVKHVCLPSLHHLPSAMNIAIVASYYSWSCAPTGYVQEKRTIMMDDVFVYHAHTFFALLCVCVGCFDYMSTSTSRELTIQALESKPGYTDAFPHRACLRIGIVTDAQGHTFEVTSFLSMDIVTRATCVACTKSYIGPLGPLTCTRVSDIAFLQACLISMPHDIYALCVASDLWIVCSYHMLGCNNAHY